MEKLTGEKLTQAVINCQSWIELKTLIKEQAPFISYSNGFSKEWEAEKLLRNMDIVKTLDGLHINFITRANGLRAKVAELIISENYGNLWE